MVLLCCNPLIFGREMIPNVVQQVEDNEIPPLILGDGAFPLQKFMLKPYRDAILPDDKGYCSYRNSQARLVTEGALERLKIKFRALFRKCKSNKESLKLYVLACVVLHNFCIELGDLVPSKFDLISDHASNRRLIPGEGMDILVLGSTNQKNFEVNKKSQALNTFLIHVIIVIGRVLF